MAAEDNELKYVSRSRPIGLTWYKRSRTAMCQDQMEGLLCRGKKLEKLFLRRMWAVVF